MCKLYTLNNKKIDAMVMTLHAIWHQNLLIYYKKVVSFWGVKSPRLPTGALPWTPLDDFCPPNSLDLDPIVENSCIRPWLSSFSISKKLNIL